MYIKVGTYRPITATYRTAAVYNAKWRTDHSTGSTERSAIDRTNNQLSLAIAHSAFSRWQSHNRYR